MKRILRELLPWFLFLHVCCQFLHLNKVSFKEFPTCAKCLLKCSQPLLLIVVNAWREKGVSRDLIKWPYLVLFVQNWRENVVTRLSVSTWSIFQTNKVKYGKQHYSIIFPFYFDDVLISSIFSQPANILLDEHGHVRISDLGLACDFSKKKPHASV